MQARLSARTSALRRSCAAWLPATAHVLGSVHRGDERGVGGPLQSLSPPPVTQNRLAGRRHVRERRQEVGGGRCQGERSRKGVSPSSCTAGSEGAAVSCACWLAAGPRGP
eukprot:135038-Chlamydomonas_euryale.AAC.3